MTFDEFHELLLENSGVTNRAVNNIVSNKNLSIKSIFFQPYQSKLDPFTRANSLITGPLVISFIALECTAISLYFAIKTIVDLVKSDSAQAKKDGKVLGNVLLSLCVSLLAAVLNPIINFIDLIGSGINSLPQKNSAQDISASVAI